MKYDFDQDAARSSDSHKWGKYPPDIIPLWVADMDFVCAEPIVRALHERVEAGPFGYSQPPGELPSVILGRLRALYQWEVGEKDLLFLPGVVTGLNLAFHLFAQPGDEVLIQEPVYSHFITDPIVHGRRLAETELVKAGDTYEIDFDTFEDAITDRTKLFVLCNPHNPVGRVYTRAELERLADICLRHDLIICADEIHSDLVYPGFRHVPIATLSTDVADRTITLMSPSKTFNTAGLGCSFAVIKNPALRRIWTTGSQGLIPHVNVMGFTAAMAGYRDGQEWLDQVLAYLEENKDFLAQYVEQRLPGVSMTAMEATYLAWLDCRASGIPGSPFRYFLQEARVALNEGDQYGRGGEGFVRLNFACPRTILTAALDRMSEALQNHRRL